MSSVKKSIVERARHERQYDRRVNEIQMQRQEGEVDRGKALDTDLVVTESRRTESEKHDTNSRSENDTHVEDADIKPVNYKVPMVEVQMTAEHNVLANEHHHTGQSKPTYSTYLLEKVDINTTPDSTNMSNREGEIYQNAKKCQVTSPLLNPSPENMTTEFANQSLKQHGQILNETSNKAKIKKEIKVLKTINIELEHSVAKLLAENEKLHKENKHLKQTYKDLYDSIKKTRVQTNDHNDSLIAQINSKTIENADLNAQIQAKILIGHRFSPKKSFAVYEKTSPGSCLRWKPTGRIFNTVGLRWVPTGKIFTSSITKVDNEPPNASNEDITNPYECEQTLNEYCQHPSSVVSPMLPAAAQLSADTTVIMEYLVKISKKALIMELKRRNMKKLILTSYTPYPSRKIRRICACTSQETTKIQSLIRRDLWKLLKEEEACLTIEFSSSEGSVQDISNNEENKADAEVAEKQDRNVQTSLTLSSAELKIQLMVDVPIHQGDPNRRDLPRDIPLDSVEVLRSDTYAGNPVKEILLNLNLPDHMSVLMEPEVHVKTEMEIPISRKVKFIIACSYSINEYDDMMKALMYGIQDIRYSDTQKVIGSQGGKGLQDNIKRRSLADDLKEAPDHSLLSM
ncbi:hypothetical protein Tco_0111723 [Tanacetum coccineum]